MVSANYIASPFPRLILARTICDLEATSTATNSFDFAMTGCSRFPLLEHAAKLAHLLNYRC